MIRLAKKKHDADKQAHIACVNGPMHGRVIPMPLGTLVVFYEYRSHRAAHRRHMYAFAERKFADKEWLYLKYQGVEK